MKSIVVDKAASVTRHCRLGREVKVSNDFPCQEGDVVAVRILTRKSAYNQLELITGRFSVLGPGDVIVGALGHRNALSGYAGCVPDSLSVGDHIQLLNLGGVLGVCNSIHPDLGPPFECEVLGQVLSFPYLGERIGVPANIRQGAIEPSDVLECDIPVVAVLGTCMDSGKTAACSRLIQELVRRRLRVAAAKATGVSLRRDVLAMEDAGAAHTMTFTDLGIVTTTPACAPMVARSLLTELAKEAPDVIVLELGDGLMGEYGVDAILSDELLRSKFTATVFAAGDPVGAWGGVLRLREQFGFEPTVITGPATDNSAGTSVIEKQIGVPAFNARVSPTELAACVCAALGFAPLEPAPSETVISEEGK